MAREIFQLQAKDAIIRLNHYDHVNLVQSFNWDPAFNEEYISQLGDEAYAAQTIQPEVTGSFEQMASGASVAFLKRMIQTFDAEGLFSGYMAGDPATADNAGSIDELDLEYAVFDLIEAKRPNDEFKRSLLLPRMFLSSIAWSMDSNGNASETYNFEGEVAEVYRAPKQDIKTYPGTQAAAGSQVVELPTLGSGAWALDGEVNQIDGTTPVADGDSVIVAIFINSEKVLPADITLTAGTPDTATIAASTPVPDGARIAILAHLKYTEGVSDPAWPTISHPTSARFMKGDKIDIWLTAPAAVKAAYDGGTLNSLAIAESDQFLRVQTANINVDLRREALRQIKKNNRGNSIYYRGSTYPLNVTSSASIFETDLWAWQKIQGKSATDVLNLADFENQEWAVVARYYYGDTAVQTIAFTDARVSGRSYNVAVDGRAEVTFDFTGSEIRLQGAVV